MKTIIIEQPFKPSMGPLAPPSEQAKPIYGSSYGPSNAPGLSTEERAKARYYELYAHMKNQGYSEAAARLSAAVSYYDINPSGTAPQAPVPVEMPEAPAEIKQPLQLRPSLYRPTTQSLGPASSGLTWESELLKRDIAFHQQKYMYETGGKWYYRGDLSREEIEQAEREGKTFEQRSSTLSGEITKFEAARQQYETKQRAISLAMAPIQRGVGEWSPSIGERIEAGAYTERAKQALSEARIERGPVTAAAGGLKVLGLGVETYLPYAAEKGTKMWEEGVRAITTHPGAQKAPRGVPQWAWKETLGVVERGWGETIPESISSVMITGPVTAGKIIGTGAKALADIKPVEGLPVVIGYYQAVWTQHVIPSGKFLVEAGVLMGTDMFTKGVKTPVEYALKGKYIAAAGALMTVPTELAIAAGGLGAYGRGITSGMKLAAAARLEAETALASAKLGVPYTFELPTLQPYASTARQEMMTRRVANIQGGGFRPGAAFRAGVEGTPTQVFDKRAMDILKQQAGPTMWDYRAQVQAYGENGLVYQPYEGWQMQRIKEIDVKLLTQKQLATARITSEYAAKVVPEYQLESAGRLMTNIERQKWWNQVVVSPRGGISEGAKKAMTERFTVPGVMSKQWQERMLEVTKKAPVVTTEEQLISNQMKALSAELSKKYTPIEVFKPRLGEYEGLVRSLEASTSKAKSSLFRTEQLIKSEFTAPPFRPGAAFLPEGTPTWDQVWSYGKTTKQLSELTPTGLMGASITQIYERPTGLQVERSLAYGFRVKPPVEMYVGTKPSNIVYTYAKPQTATLLRSGVLEEEAYKFYGTFGTVSAERVDYKYAPLLSIGRVRPPEFKMGELPSYAEELTHDVDALRYWEGVSSSKTAAITSTRQITDTIVIPITTPIIKPKPPEPIRFEPITPPKFKPPKFEWPKEEFPKLPPSLSTERTFGEEDLRKRGGGFDVYAKVRGEFVPIAKGMEFGKATIAGAKYVSFTPARSFKVVPAGAPKTERGIKLGYDSRFYEKGGTFIEKTRHAIDTIGEYRGITLKGIAARKFKRGRKVNIV